MTFPSRDFDDAVAAVCHGTASDEQIDALGARLRGDAAARDAYLHRLALHAHLASDPALFAALDPMTADPLSARCPITVPDPAEDQRMPARVLRARFVRNLALAAGIAVLLGAAAWLGLSGRGSRASATSRAVAMLNRTVNARWSSGDPVPRLGAPLEPGRLRLESGLAQVVFYNGARVVIEGPAELRLLSSTAALCPRGTLTAEVPPQAHGFRIDAPGLEVTDLGTAFGLRVAGDRSELHVFEGEVAFRAGDGATAAPQHLLQGHGAIVEADAVPKLIAADPSAFAELFDLQAKSVAADARRYDQWRESVRKLRHDPSLWVHLDFEHSGGADWRLLNSGSLADTMPDATIVGCEWREGRWATKPALEFRGISDRLRLSVPGELESVTLAAWVRVQGLDRQINSLLMSDGFAPGTLHWVIRNDGVLGLTVIGDRGNHQIIASPPVFTIDQFGLWTHLAVALDARARQVTHYVNGRPVSRHALRIAPPFHLGAAELGNWNAAGFPGHDPFLIRSFSGAMDEFSLFNRVLAPAEIAALHAEGRPQPDTLAKANPEVR